LIAEDVSPSASQVNNEAGVKKEAYSAAPNAQADSAAKN
jgi:hypothetical protein